jgi:hypothetical protein
MTMLKRNEYETAVFGKEPLWTDCSVLDEMQISSRHLRAINWYNYFCSEEDYKDFVIDYCKSDERITKELLSKIKGMDKHNFLFRNIGCICRIKTLGGRVGSKDERYFIDKYSELLSLAEKEKQEEQPQIPVPRPSVQHHIHNKICDTICELESKIDEFITTSDYKQFMKSFNVEAWITNNKLKSYECQAICDHYSQAIKEKQDALEGKDPQLTEAHDYFGKIKLKKYVELLSTIVDVSGQYALQKGQRKPRKKKKKSAEKLIKSLKYQREDKDLGLTSIDPRDIIGATKLVVYNTKYSKVCIFESESLDGFSVKGTTVQNVSKGLSKIVRNPKDFFKSITGGIRSINNHYERLKTKETEATARINENTIIVKAFK